MGGPPTKRSTSSAHSPVVMEKLRSHATSIVDKIFQNSTIENHFADYPPFDETEVQLGKVLGKGGFGTVYEVRAFSIHNNNSGGGGGARSKNHATTTTSNKLQRGISKKSNNSTSKRWGGGNNNIDDDDDLVMPDINRQTLDDNRRFLAEHCLRNNSDARFALKQLSPEVVADAGSFLQGMTDMAIETRFLGDILHPNIVKLRAVATTTTNGSIMSEHYFLVMDRLYDTLERRIYKVWQKKDNLQKSFLGKQILDRKGFKKNELYTERIVYAYDLSSAVSFLHSRKIIYRDLKPENVGFDVRNDIKLFDFGLARELQDSLRTTTAGDDDLYNLTVETGSPRYMAPEVGLGKPYNAKCDSYSFCILLWEMLALKTPYECYTMKSLKDRVFNSALQKRPFVNTKWPEPIQKLLARGWAHNVDERCTMDDVEMALRKECLRVRDGDDMGLDHDRRRSTFVFPGAAARAGAGATTNKKKTAASASEIAAACALDLSSSCSSLRSAGGHDDGDENKQNDDVDEPFLENNKIDIKEQPVALPLLTTTTNTPVSCDSSC